MQALSRDITPESKLLAGQGVLQLYRWPAVPQSALNTLLLNVPCCAALSIV
jgi:hypothetical protein